MSESTAGEDRQRTQRLVFRCVSEFLIDESRDLIALHERDFVRAIIFLAIAQSSRGGEDDQSRSVSVRAIAQSLGLPYETTRRKALELETRGYCRRVSPQRVGAATAAVEGSAAQAAYAQTLRRLTEVIGNLKALGFSVGTADPAGRPEPDPADLAREVGLAVQAFMLRVLETGVGPHGSMLDALVYTALIQTNAEAITFDPEMAWKYSGAETPPPDNVRRPATIAGLAQRLAIPRETMRRRIARMVELGRCEAVRGGYLATMTFMQTPEVLETGARIAQRFGQLMQAVRNAGMDVEVIAPSELGRSA